MSAICAKIAADDVKIGLVSTMGDIQPRHLSLIQTARTMADVVVLAIFAARLHFESDQEYDSYPRDFVHDVDLLRREKVDYLFNPTEEEIFPPRFSTFVSVEGFGEKLPGLSRRPLFTGMPTTILKMIQIVKPTFIFFDQKDALQSAILRKMIMDLGINTELVVSPSGRDAARHANGYGSLSESQKAAAAALHRSLRAAENAVAAGELQAKKLTQEITRELETESQVEIEYAVIADALTLEPLAKLRGQVLISVGVQIGGTSLNDSMLIEIPTGK